ncbi:MAG: PEGA domain-containing protein [Myxococcales bacterium]|nr:PEGA domain-containing protein [Polyangiaceae bacterium]MDW8247934.1 PEGA domain-containing protein [Myxococcales bacterium]
MLFHFHRVLACALSASMFLTPCASVLAQKKKEPAPKTDPKKAKKPPTKANRDKAKAAFSRGNEKFNAGDFAGAAEAYKEAHATIPTAQALYKMALALEKAGKGAEALEAYQQFLAFPPPDTMAEQKSTAEGRIQEMSVGKVNLSSTPVGATVTIDGQPASGPTPLTLSLKPGAHTLELSAPNHEPATREITVAPASITDLVVELKEIPPPPAPSPPPPPPPSPLPPPEPAAPPPPPPEEPPPSKIPAYVTLGLAGAGAVVGTIFGFQALSAKSDFNSKPTTKNADDAERNALIADMAFGVAVTLGITGTVLLLSGNKKPESTKSSKIYLAPVLTPQTQGAAATFRF